MRKLITAACIATLAAFGPIHSAKAASVDVDVEITLPSFLILYCYDNIAVNITAADLGTALGATNDAGVDLTPGTLSYSASAGEIQVPMAIDTDTNADLSTAVNLILQDICGVRAIATNGTASVSIQSPATELAGPAGAGTIAVDDITTSLGTAANNLTITGGLGTLNTFDVTMELDLANVIAAGAFSAAGGDAEFTVNVVTP